MLLSRQAHTGQQGGALRASPLLIPIPPKTPPESAQNRRWEGAFACMSIDEGKSTSASDFLPARSQKDSEKRRWGVSLACMLIADDWSAATPKELYPMAAKIKLSPLEQAENLLHRKLITEDAYKLASSVGQKTGTHDGYVRVEHRASQRSVERLQAKIMILKGAKSSPTSTDRAEVRLLALALAKCAGKFTGDPQVAYARARSKNLGSEWLAACARKAPAALAKLWEAGVKSAELQSAIKYACEHRGLNCGD